MTSSAGLEPTIDSLTRGQIEAEVERILDEKLENYFRMSRPGFSIESGVKTGAHGISEYCLTTDSVQGLHFYEQGNCKLVGNKTTEIWGGFDQEKDTDPGILIRSEGGSIHIEAPNGDLVFKGNNIKFYAKDTFHVEAASIFNVTAPSMDFVGDYVTMIGNLDLSFLGGGTLNIHGDTSTDISDGVDVFASGSLIDKLISQIEKILKLGIFA